MTNRYYGSTEYERSYDSDQYDDYGNSRSLSPKNSNLSSYLSGQSPACMPANKEAYQKLVEATAATAQAVKTQRNYCYQCKENTTWFYKPDPNADRDYACESCKVKSESCPVCQKTRENQKATHCTECLRALHVAGLQTTQTLLVTQQQKQIDELKAIIAELSKQQKDIIEEMATVKKAIPKPAAKKTEYDQYGHTVEYDDNGVKYTKDRYGDITDELDEDDCVIVTTPKKDKDKTNMATSYKKVSETPDLKVEVQDGLWRAGVQTLTEQLRDVLAAGLVSDLPDEEQAAAKILVRRCLNGKWGVPLVASVAGGALYVANSHAVELPLVSQETTERLGREFRVLGVASASKEMMDAVVAPVRSIAGGLVGTVQGLDKIGKLAAGTSASKSATAS